jgi:CubicO group peptidase (beta-lactamase class C family)
MKFFVVCWLCLVSLLPRATFATASVDFSALEQFIHNSKDALAHPYGTAVAVVSSGKIVYQGYFGFADVQARIPVDAETEFYIASATKPIFALHVLLQQHAGKLDVNTSLQQMFPQLHFVNVDADSVSARDLLIHASGIANSGLTWATAYSGLHDAQSRLALIAASYPDENSALASFKYSNVGYNIVSQWLDQLDNAAWQDQLDASVLQPLGMYHTSARMSKAVQHHWRMARSYSYLNARPHEPLYLSKSDATMHAAGGLVSTAQDLARFLITELGHDEHIPLPRSVIRQSQTMQITLDSQYLDFVRTGYAWGWYGGPYKGKHMLHHFGEFSGFHAHLSFMPDQDIGLVVLNNENVVGARLSSLIADYVYGLALGEPAIQQRASARTSELVDAAQQLRLTMDKQRKLIQARPWTLSLPRHDYSGRYGNDLLGEVKVHLDVHQQMHIQWGQVASVASAGQQADQVRVEFAPHAGQWLEFSVEGDRVDSLVFAGMRFNKLPGARDL